ncbi:MAG: FprA family A-type flavoprotein [Prevotella sp.]|nr:FprA family A-type flavoprotein [Prevotella sp.]
MKTEITKGIYYIGADDRELDLFEGQYETPEGISYNSHVIIDNKIAVFDTIDERKAKEWKQNLAEVLGERKPDYLIVEHMEPDHSSLVKEMIDTYPDMKIVCSAPAVKMMARFFGAPVPADRVITVKDNDTLELGEHTLQFFTAGMIHWPEVIMAYEQKDGILFSADAFGKFGALSYDDPEGWACEARRYYFNIVGKYGAQVQTLLKKVAGLNIKKICPLHGPVLDENIEYYVNTYNTWSAYEPEDKGIFIAYCSLHGNTEKAALKLAEILKSKSDIKVSVSDLRRDDLHEAVEDAFRYDRVVLAAPTYDAGVMPIMADFIHHLAIKNYQNRRVAIIENGSWAPAAGKKMREAMEAMKNITIIEPIVTVESTVKADTIEKLNTLADALL